MTELQRLICPHSAVTQADAEGYAVCTRCYVAVYVGPLRLADLERTFQHILNSDGRA